MTKYFTDLVTETGLLLKSISIVGIGLVILVGIINAEDFSGKQLFCWRSSILVHSVTHDLSYNAKLTDWLRGLSDTQHQQIIWGVVFKALDTLFIYIKNNKGFKLLPWGTPN